MSNRSLQDVLPTRSTTNTQTFLDTCVLDADHKALEEHLGTNAVQQSDLDKCLLRVIQIVQQKEKELSVVAHALTLLLQAGAKWNNDVLLDKKTPLHIMCESPSDQHQLLDLMIKSSVQPIIDTEDINKRTALMCAVENVSINCVKCLIANGADVTIGDETYQSFRPAEIKPLTPIMKVIWMFNHCRYASVIMSNIFDLLLDAAVHKNKDYFRNCTEYVPTAIAACNLTCAQKLIKIGAPLDVISGGRYVWAAIAIRGNVEWLKSMFNHGFDKDSIDQNGFSVLSLVVTSGNLEAVRYLLDLGVNVPTYPAEERRTQCEQCKDNTLLIESSTPYLQDPCIRAIQLSTNRLEIVKLLDEYGTKSCKSFYALRCAIKYRSVDVVAYLLNKYTYPLNVEYIIQVCGASIFTLLTDIGTGITDQTIKLLLDHGADPAKQMCSAKRDNAIMIAIRYGHLYAIAQYIRSGVNINLRSWNSTYGKVSPFEASVLHDRPCVSVLLLISGCSRKFKVDPEPRLEKLMKEWNVYDDKVTPLKQQCRSVILNHLSPRAVKKIGKLPLPPCLIKFLSIPELDNF